MVFMADVGISTCHTQWVVTVMKIAIANNFHPITLKCMRLG